jgi:hypothetical protein
MKVLNGKKKVGLGRRAWKPSRQLKAAEDAAVSIAKVLRHWKEVFGGYPGSASVEDAIALADLVAKLAAFGRRAGAEETMDLARRVEHLLDRLQNEVDELLASIR